MAKTRKDKKIKLQSSESTYSYTTVRRPGMDKKLELKKYDPLVRKHVVFKEMKITSGKKK